MTVGPPFPEIPIWTGPVGYAGVYAIQRSGICPCTHERDRKLIVLRLVYCIGYGFSAGYNIQLLVELIHLSLSLSLSRFLRASSC